MIYCSSCGKALHESARFCPNCGYTLKATPESGQSVWMAIVALVISIVVLILLLASAGDIDALNALAELESAFGGNTLRKKLAEELQQIAVGALVLAIPGWVLAIASLVQKRGGRGMAIASLVINGVNLLFILGFFGLSLEA